MVSSATQSIHESPTTRTVYVVDQKESCASRKLESIFGPIIVLTGAAGFIAGGVVGAAHDHAYPLVTSIATGVVTVALSTLVLNGCQKAADVIVDSTIYVIKLPLSLPGAIKNGCLAAQRLVNQMQSEKPQKCNQN